jgi:hypothetical protein
MATLVRRAPASKPQLAGDFRVGEGPSGEVVEGAAELGILIAQDIPHSSSLLAEHRNRLRACWATQVPLGLTVTPAR